MLLTIVGNAAHYSRQLEMSAQNAIEYDFFTETMYDNPSRGVKSAGKHSGCHIRAIHT